jgi:hypothetical protein
MGFAILGLGCTIPLTIGGDIDSNVVVPSEDDGGEEPGNDAGPPDSGPSFIDSGVALDAGAACLPSNPFQQTPLSSQQGLSSHTSFSTCCSHDVMEGFCYSVPQGWSCSNFRVCTWDNGGSCFSTGHTCDNYADCCSRVCYKGLCAATNYTGDNPASDTPGSSCKSLQVWCGDYSECCSQNCAFGMCAPAPAPTTCGGFLASCVTSNDCCSLECDNGNCRDSSLPWYLQSVGSQLSSQVSSQAPNSSEMAPRFQLNRTDNPLAPDPIH